MQAKVCSVLCKNFISTVCPLCCAKVSTISQNILFILVYKHNGVVKLSLKVLESLSNSTTLIDKVVAVIDKGYTTFQYMKTKHLFLKRFCLKLINFTWTDSLQKLLKSVGVYGTKKQYFALKSIYLKILLWTMHAPGGTNNIVCASLILVNYDPIYFFLLRNFELRILIDKSFQQIISICPREPIIRCYIISNTCFL